MTLEFLIAFARLIVGALQCRLSLSAEIRVHVYSLALPGSRDLERYFYEVYFLRGEHPEHRIPRCSRLTVVQTGNQTENNYLF